MYYLVLYTYIAASGWGCSRGWAEVHAPREEDGPGVQDLRGLRRGVRTWAPRDPQRLFAGQIWLGTFGGTSAFKGALSLFSFIHGCCSAFQGDAA